MAVTQEQRQKILELALINHLNKKQSKIFSQPMERQHRQSPPPPTRRGCIELIRTCPECGSQNILEPEDNATWLCDDCMVEFDEPLWSEKKAQVEIDSESARRARAAKKRDEKWLQEQQREQKLQAQQAETQARREVLVAERAAQSTHPVCPNCGTASYRRCGKQYRCQKCGAGFVQPLKPGRTKAPKKLYYINDWRQKKAAKHERKKAKQKAKFERKFEAAKARWHEKFGNMPQP